MVRLAIVCLTFVLLAVFGCTGPAKETYVKCPKCGYYFKTKEGADWFHTMGQR
jgi:hypothetical protein